MNRKELKIICDESRAYRLLKAPASESIEHIDFFKISADYLCSALKLNESLGEFSTYEVIMSKAMLVSIKGLLTAFELNKKRKTSNAYEPSYIYIWSIRISRYFLKLERNDQIKGDFSREKPLRPMNIACQ